MITTQALIDKFNQALSENWGYIWGTAGESWTAARQAALEKTTDPDRAQGRQYGKRWIGHKVADCSGLFSWAFRQLGGTMYHGSDTMYKKYCADKGELKKGKRTDGAALKPGTAVFVWNGSKYSHVGLYIGNGTVIEAMSTLQGVTTSKVTASKWKYWGELTGVKYAGGNSELTATGENPSSGVISTGAEGGVEKSSSATSDHPTLRKGSKGQAVTEMQIMLDKLGYDLGSYGVDGDFGKCTLAAVKKFQQDHGLTVDGICGPATWAKLEKVIALSGEKGTWNKGTVPSVTDSVGTEGLSLTFQDPASEAKYCVISYAWENEVARDFYRSFGFRELNEPGWYEAGDEISAVLEL